MDKETVITHLQIIHTWAEFARERDLQFFTAKHLKDIAQWADDALNLLKEQEASKHVCASCKNNADNLANGTRCPIQEHYGLPKDGFCHLWEGEENAESTL